MNKIEIDAKDVYAMTWNYFQQHAQQRIACFNFFVVFQALMTTGLLATFQPHFKTYFVGVGIGLLQALISFVFWKVDQRNKYLTKHGENAIIEFEQDYTFLPPDAEERPNPIKLFSAEVFDTTKLRVSQRYMEVWNQQWSYSKCFNSMFVAFGVIGVIGALLSGLHSLEWLPGV
jgi:hypothetical protein